MADVEICDIIGQDPRVESVTTNQTFLAQMNLRCFFVNECTCNINNIKSEAGFRLQSETSSLHPLLCSRGIRGEQEEEDRAKSGRGERMKEKETEW